MAIAANGYQISQAKKAIEAMDGCSIELIDHQSQDPFDVDTILRSVAKTGRLLLVHEDYRICSISEYIAYEAYSNLSLRSKIELISSKFAPVPFFPSLGKAFLPQVEDIINGIKKALGSFS